MSDRTRTDFPALGASPEADGTSVFRVWAPAAETVAVVTDAGPIDMAPVGDALFEARWPIAETASRGSP
jgi:1,4-alpha-glucan branching enzyme